MTREEKDLLLKDLCARFPYGVKVELHGEVCTVLGYYNDFDFDDFVILTSNTPTGQQTNIANIKPYLRPLSSMTSDEKMEWFQMRQNHCDMSGFNEIQERADFTSESSDWLNAHHFDYRGLIEKGLALEAPEGMYND